MYRILFSLMLAMASATAVAGPDYIEEGDRYSAQGDWDKAIASYEKAATGEQDRAMALTRMGGAMLARQRYSDSIGYFQQAISEDAASHGAFIGLGISYLHMGRYELSRAALEEARKLPSGKQEDIDKMIAWIDRKTPPGHP
jgi:tetratricopeptide (TPR) repeat protein